MIRSRFTFISFTYCLSLSLCTTKSSIILVLFESFKLLGSFLGKFCPIYMDKSLLETNNFFPYTGLCTNLSPLSFFPGSPKDPIILSAAFLLVSTYPFKSHKMINVSASSHLLSRCLSVVL